MKPFRMLRLLVLVTGVLVAACSQPATNEVTTVVTTPGIVTDPKSTSSPRETSTSLAAPTKIVSIVQTPIAEPKSVQSSAPDTLETESLAVAELRDGEVAEGEDLFTFMVCIACHGNPVGSNPAVIGPDLSQIGVTAAERIDGYTAAEYILESITTPDKFISSHCPSGECIPSIMVQDFADRLSTEETSSLVAFLLSATEKSSASATTESTDADSPEESDMQPPAVGTLGIDTQIVTIDIERIDLPAGSFSTYQTEQAVSSLFFDDAGNLWTLMTDGYVRWNTVTGDYSRMEPPLEIATSVPPSPYFYCQDLASELGMENTTSLFFASCLYSSKDSNYWFAAFPFGDEGGGIHGFDGNNWMYYSSQDGLPDDKVSQLIVDQAGVLWAATFGGIASYDGEVWTTQLVGEDESDSAMTAMAIDTDGDIWVGKRNGRLMRFDGEIWTEHDIGIQGEAISRIITDSSGTLWIPAWPTLYLLEDGVWHPISLDPSGESYYPVRIQDVDRTSGDQIWIATESGVLLEEDERMTWYGVGDGLVGDYVMDVLIGPDDTPWFATGSGVSHYDGNNWQTFVLQEGPGIAYPMSAFNDARGKLWFGGIDGVVAFEVMEVWQRYPEFSEELALINFALTSEGELVGAGCSGVYQYSGDDWQSIFGRPEASNPSERMPWCATKIAVAKDGSIWVDQMDIYQDRSHGVLHFSDKGSEWYGSENDVRYAAQPELMTIAPWNDGAVTAILPRDDGAVWFGTSEGLFILSEGTWARLPEAVYGESQWITTGTIGPEGDAWFGTPLGLARFDGEKWTRYQIIDQTDLDLFAINFDATGIAWISALEGTGRFDGEKLLLYTYGVEGPFMIERAELLGVSIAGIADSIAFGPDNTLWMPGGPQGILRIDLPSP